MGRMAQDPEGWRPECLIGASGGRLRAPESAGRGVQKDGAFGAARVPPSPPPHASANDPGSPLQGPLLAGPLTLDPSADP